jgi:hypothetical protein
MGGGLTKLRKDIARDPWPFRFEGRRAHAVVADERIGLAENLAVIGRVGNGFRVTDDTRIKNDFPPDFGAGAEPYALVDGAVRKGQNGFPNETRLPLIFALV